MVSGGLEKGWVLYGSNEDMGIHKIPNQIYYHSIPHTFCFHQSQDILPLDFLARISGFQRCWNNRSFQSR